MAVAFPAFFPRRAKSGAVRARAHQYTRAATPPIASHVRNVDAMLCELAAARDRLVLPLARAARLFHDARGWTPVGYAQPNDWAREQLGRSASWLRRLACIDRAVERHPALGVALTGADGGPPIGTAAMLEIAGVCHVAPPGVVITAGAFQHEWIARARTLSLAQLRELVASVEAPSAAGAAESDVRDVTAAPAGHRSFASALMEVKDTPQSIVRLMAPPDVLEAFEQALDLHRAVTGRESGAVSFVEALCAEAASGAFPFDVQVRPVQRATQRAMPGRGVHLKIGEGVCGESVGDERACDSSALRRAAGTLQRFARIEQDLQACTQPPSPARLRRLASHLAELVVLENVLEVRIGELLADLDAQRPWRVLRFTGVAHYAEERLRMNRTTARDRVEVARGLRKLPIVERAYESDRIGLEKALLILRVSRLEPLSVPKQTDWLERVATGTLKRCRDEYRTIRREHVLRQSDPASVTTLAGAGHGPLSDAAWLASIRRTPGQTRALVLDVGCRVLDREQNRRWSPVVCKPLRLPEETARSLASAIDTARRVLVAEAARVEAAHTSPASEARLRPSVRIARLFVGKPTGVPAWLGLLGLLEEYVLTWDAPEAMPDRARSAIHERDGYRCTAPGCTQRAMLEAHHLRYRSSGGGNEPSNLITLCAFHHRLGEHGMYATCSGTAPLDVVWGLGRADLRTWYRNELRLDA
jgi:hypothetical protein